MLTFSFKYRIDGIPCHVKVYTVPEPLKEIRNADILTSDPAEFDDAMFDILDRNMRKACWLEKKLNSDIRHDITWKAMQYMNGDYIGESWE